MIVLLFGLIGFFAGLASLGGIIIELFTARRVPFNVPALAFLEIIRIFSSDLTSRPGLMVKCEVK